MITATLHRHTPYAWLDADYCVSVACLFCGRRMNVADAWLRAAIRYLSGLTRIDQEVFA